jgi:hypothetical protein
MSRLGVASFGEHRVLTADVQTLQFIFYGLTGNLTVSGLSASLRVRPQVFGSNARLPTPKA